MTRWVCRPYPSSGRSQSLLASGESRLPAFPAVHQHSYKTRAQDHACPLFPRYLFDRFDLDVTKWRVKCDPRGAAPIAAMGVFTKGLKVRIKSGAFAGQTAEVNEIFAEGRDRVHVLLTLMGAEAELQLPSYAIVVA